MPKKKPVTNSRTTERDPTSIEAQIQNAKALQVDAQTIKSVNQSDLSPPSSTKAELPPDALNLPMERRPSIPIKSFKPKQRIIDKLLDPDNTYMAQIREKVEQGASKATIDALLGMPPGTINSLLEKGKLATDHKNKYKKFYLLYRKWAGEARSVAEAITLHKTPEKWMDRNSSNKLLESEEDRTIIQQSPTLTGPNHSSGVTPQQLLASLKILQEQGISIDEALSKDAITLDAPTLPNKDDEDDE